MKKLLMLLIISILFSCNNSDNKGKTPLTEIHEGGIKIIFPPIKAMIAPTILQDAFYYNDLYYLQTYVSSNEDEIHPRSYENFNITSYTKYCMYINEIHGTSDYIKKNKKKEYDKAKYFMKTKSKNNKEIDDNLKELNSIKIK